MPETIATAEKVKKSTVETAENIKALLDQEPNPDNAVAELVEETGQSFREHRGANEEETVIANEVGILEVIDPHTKHKETTEALSHQDEAQLWAAIEGLEDDYDLEDFLHHVPKNIDDTVNPFIEQHKLNPDNITYDRFKEEIKKKNEVKLTAEEFEEQIGHVNALLDAKDYTTLNQYLLSAEKVDKHAIQNIFILIGEEVFSAEMWSDDSREEAFAQLATTLINKIPQLPSKEQIPILKQAIGLDKKNNPRYMNIREICLNDPEGVADLTEFLVMTNNLDHLVRDVNYLAVTPKELAEIIYANGRPDLVVNHLYHFPNINLTRLEDSLYEHNKFMDLGWNIEKFPDCNKRRLYEALASENQMYMVLNQSHLRVFLDAGIQPQEIFDKCVELNTLYLLDKKEILEKVDIAKAQKTLLAGHQYKIIIEFPEIFSDITPSEILDRAIESGDGYQILSGIKNENFQIDVDVVYERILATDNPSVIFVYAELFTEEQLMAAVEPTIKAGDLATLLYEKETNNRLESLKIEDIIEMAIEYNQGPTLLQYPNILSGIHPNEFIETYLAKGKYYDLVESLEMLGTDDSTKERIYTSMSGALESPGELAQSDFLTINHYLATNYSSSQIPEDLKLANRYMGSEGLTVVGYQIVKQLSNEEPITDNLRDLGVTKTGVKGLEQFGEACRGISQQLMSAEIDNESLAKVIDSDLYLGILQNEYRVDIAEYEALGSDELRELLKNYAKASAKGDIAPMPQEYTRLETDVITLAEGTKKKEITPDALERYNMLRNDILGAISLLKGEHPFRRKLAELGDKMVKETEVLTEQASKLHETKEEDPQSYYKSRAINEKLEALQGLLNETREGKYIGENFVLRSPEDLSHVFDQLEKFESLHSDMRQLLFAWALRKKPGKQESLGYLGEEPTIDDLASVHSFVEQLVNQETFGNYFADKKTATKFKKMSSVRSIEEALVRFQKQAKSAATQPLTLIPTRSAAIELSGFVGDACWANKYESVAAEFPNITSVILKRGEAGSTTERLVGSALLIETTDDEGNGVLLLRGVNPTENYVNKVRVEDFYQTMANYTRSIAAKRGLKPAVVIDDHSGGAGTNRPVLHEYMLRMRENMKKMPVDSSTTTFNGYDVSEMSFAL